MQPPQFSDDFRRQFRELLAWRRDVRRFRRQPIDPVIFGELLGLACLAPSVGNSQPWRFVLVEDPGRRERIRDIFARCNDAARAASSGTRAALYGQLKLAGLQEAPCHLAVFVAALGVRPGSAHARDFWSGCQRNIGSGRVRK